MSIAGYTLSEGEFEVTDKVKENFDDNGFIVVRNLLSPEEVNKIRTHLEKSKAIEQYAYGVDDGHSRQSRMCLWNQPGDDLTGMLARCHKVAGTCDKLLGGEVYHYHTKLMMKEALTGGKWNWHQDYGYWYHNTCLFPDMMTVFIALDGCNKENGCLQVMPGSHKCGRVEHEMSGEQTGVEPERLEQLQQTLTPTLVELNPGDGIFFHCNLLHTSSANNSPNRRWALGIAYNRASNNPVKEHHHPKYTKLNKVPNSAILECPDGDLDVKNKDIFVQEQKKKFQDVLSGKDTY